MGLFDNFLNKAPAQTTPQADPNAAAVVPAAGNLQDPNIVAQQGSVSAVAPEGPASDPANAGDADTPLAEFKNLWDTEPTNKADPSLAPTPLVASEIQALVAKQDFSAMITPEMLATVPEEQHAAFTSAMNLVAQNVMTQSTMVNSKLNAQSIEQAEKRFAATLPELLRKQAVTNHANETNPLLNNPAIKPVVEATRTQLLQQYPNATQAQITEMTENYITQMGAAFAPAPVEPTAVKEQDFSNFLEKGTVG